MASAQLISVGAGSIVLSPGACQCMQAKQEVSARSCVVFCLGPPCLTTSPQVGFPLHLTSGAEWRPRAAGWRRPAAGAQ